MSRLLAYSRVGRFVSKDRGLFRFGLFPTGMSFGAWDDHKAYREDEAFLRTHLRHGDLVIDVGANVGFVSLAAAALVGSGGAVIAFEAHPVTFRYLQNNVRLNAFENVRLINAAAGCTTGSVRFSDSRLDDINTVSDEGIEVRMVRIDDMVPEGKDVALLKVDVEGYEKFVLEGASKTLQRTRIIYFEVCDSHFDKFGYRTSDLMNMLSEHGFECFTRDEEGAFVPVPDGFAAPRAINLLATRREAKS